MLLSVKKQLTRSFYAGALVTGCVVSYVFIEVDNFFLKNEKLCSIFSFFSPLKLTNEN